jgi:hypothetical protein
MNTKILESKKEKYVSTFNLRCYNHMMVTIFPQMCGTNSRSKHIPSFIFSLEIKLINEFLKYLFLGDGHKEENGTWSYTTNSLRLLSGLCLIYKTIGKDFTIIYRENKKCWQLIERRSEATIRPRPKKSKISETDGIGFVYDMEVDSDSHVFTDACGFVLLHNTDDMMGRNHLSNINTAFPEKDYDWVYYNDFIYDGMNQIPKIVSLEKGSIGTSSIAHLTCLREKGLSWAGCDGYTHDWKYVERLLKFNRYKKIYGCSYFICHIPDQVNS